MTMVPTSSSQQTEEGTYHVLHVDDQPEFTEMASVFLEREDDRFVVETAISAREGLDRLAEQAFDCVISDFDMPGGNGIEFLEHVREEFPNLPFILFTGKGTEEVASDAISAGVTDYLQKRSGTDQYALLANRVKNAVRRARAERRAETSQARYRTLIDDVLDTSDIGTFILNDDFDIICLNTAIEEYFGMNRGEVIGTDQQQLIESDIADIFEQPERFKELVTDTYEDNTYVEGFTCHVLPDNDRQERWLKHWSQPIESGLYNGGRIEHYTDITTQQKQVRELERSREFFEEAERLADIGAWEFDAAGNVEWSDGTRRIHEVDEDFEPSVETGIEFYHPDDRETIRQAVETAIETGEPYNVEARIITANDNERWIHTRGMPLGDGQKVRGFIQDITEEKEREQELQHQNERLDTFTSVVSHDLRNPLNVASGRLELAQDDCESEDLADVYHALERMETLIDDLLILARHGDSVSEREPIALAALLDTCWASVETTEATLNIEVERTINADKSQLKQIFENLYRNAVEHGGEDVTTTIGELDDGFYIEDNGPGIPADDREEIFEAGYSTNHEGTGFGLVIVKDIVEAHDWGIRVTDSESGGARFEITGVESV